MGNGCADGETALAASRQPAWPAGGFLLRSRLNM